MNTLILLIVVTLAVTYDPAEGSGQRDQVQNVIFAVNAGGPKHVDLYGVTYQEDILTDGIASDHGKRFDIRRAPVQDQILYQTERYGLTTFGYDIPITEDGVYVIVLKFCEVYFGKQGEKIFNVVLNNEHLVISDLDIFREVGKATAHDEYIQFRVANKGKTLSLDGTESRILGGSIRIKFVKGSADNPKINALFAIKGTLNDVPPLPPLQSLEKSPPTEVDVDDLFEEEYNEDFSSNIQDYSNYLKSEPNSNPSSRVRSGPLHMDPWDKETAFNTYLPISATLVLAVFSFALVFSLLRNLSVGDIDPLNCLVGGDRSSQKS